MIGRLASVFLVLAVLVLMAASYPVPVVVGFSGLATEADRKAGDEVKLGEQGVVPGKARETLATVDPEKEAAVRTLAKLKLQAETASKPRPAPVEIPTRIRVPAINVDAGFEYVGLTSDGAMDVPKEAKNVAWYRLGPKPGEPGNAVVAGHVDWGGKTAVFWGLRQLKAGDGIEIVAADNREYEFVVEWVRSYEAANAPVDEVFGQSSATELTLITCGGEFDRNTRQYLSRVVVRAVAQ